MEESRISKAIEKDEDRIYILFGKIEKQSSEIQNLDYRISEYIERYDKAENGWKEDLKQIFDHIHETERRLDKIEWKVGAVVAMIMFALNHVGEVAGFFKGAVALAMGL